MRRPHYIKGAALLAALAVMAWLVSDQSPAFLLIIVILLALGCLALAYSLAAQLRNALVKPARRIYAKDFNLKFLATLMGFFLLGGTLLYIYVFRTINMEGADGHPVAFSNAEYLLRSLVCSLDLFMLDVDSNILDRLDGHGALKGWISVQAVLSFACTVAMLVGIVYSRLKAYYRLHYRKAVTPERNHLYIFFGNNEPSELLASDIMQRDPKAVTVIVDEANVSEDDHDEWEGIVGLIAHKRRVFRVADRIGAHVAIAAQQLDDIDGDITARPDFDAFGYLGIPRVRKLIERLSHTSGAQLHIFFMGENEELNIRNIIALAKDSTLTHLARQATVRHRIYCHARFNGPNRVIQDVALKKHLDIRIVDSSHMAVELLKLDSRFHPVRVASLSKDNPATVDRPLRTLIVGFGEVGRDAFRFLYEFGAFADARDPGRRSPFECVIVDKNIDAIKGSFKAAMPAIFHDSAPEGVSIRFVDADCHSDQFQTGVLSPDFLAGVNYIVISIGDNDEAIALAARIFERVRRVREDMANLRILVRCTDDSKVEGIQKIADHYNHGYGRGAANEPVINIFGQPEKTYTYDLVVSDSIIAQAKAFLSTYNRLRGDTEGWDERHKNLAGSMPPSLDSLRKLHRKESQDIANALHAGTKMHILSKTLAPQGAPGPDWLSFRIRYFKANGAPNCTGKHSAITYPGLTEAENSIVRTLAMTEHLRWNAAHELMGYVTDDAGHGCNERTMRHNCLCAWQRLDSESLATGYDYKAYDYAVVDTTLALHLPDPY